VPWYPHRSLLALKLKLKIYTGREFQIVMQISSGYCVGCLRGAQVESVARTKAPGKRHNSSGRSDFMPDFNYQYAPSTAGDRQLEAGIQSQINSDQARNPAQPQSPRSRHVQQLNNGHKSFHMPNVWSMIGRLQQLQGQE